MLSYQVVPGAMEKLIASIKQRVADKVENIGLKVYNTIVLGELTGTKYPYYSGAYISSWQISKGIPKAKFNISYGVPNVYAPPSPKLDLGGVRFGQRVVISNAAPHAAQVEFKGTPTHPTPWLTATRARNQVVMSYKFL